MEVAVSFGGGSKLYKTYHEGKRKNKTTAGLKEVPSGIIRHVSASRWSSVTSLQQCSLSRKRSCKLQQVGAQRKP